MSDDPFADLDKDMGDAMGDDQDDESDPASAAEPGSATDPDPEDRSRSEFDSTGETDDPHSTSAFEFSETNQEQFYVRVETWGDWEKARDAQLKPALVMDVVEFDTTGLSEAASSLQLKEEGKLQEAAYKVTDYSMSNRDSYCWSANSS